MDYDKLTTQEQDGILAARLHQAEADHFNSELNREQAEAENSKEAAAEHTKASDTLAARIEFLKGKQAA